MKKLIMSVLIAGVVALTSAFTPMQDVVKYVSKKGHVNIFSHTDAEDIKADNYQVSSVIKPASGDIIFVITMQSFEFPKALMQKHFNMPKFLDTKQFPKSKFKGKITNLSDIDFTKDGTYTANVTGDLTLHGVTKNVTEKGTITIKAGQILASTEFNIILADYNIAFEKGKPSTNIAKSIAIKVTSEYEIAK
jgi:polyisoprenoid-binding protein YceI